MTLSQRYVSDRCRRSVPKHAKSKKKDRRGTKESGRVGSASGWVGKETGRNATQQKTFSMKKPSNKSRLLIPKDLYTVWPFSLKTALVALCCRCVNPKQIRMHACVSRFHRPKAVLVFYTFSDMRRHALHLLHKRCKHVVRPYLSKRMYPIS
jgi:hypothetical protein